MKHLAAWILVALMAVPAGANDPPPPPPPGATPAPTPRTYAANAVQLAGSATALGSKVTALGKGMPYIQGVCVVGFDNGDLVHVSTQGLHRWMPATKGPVREVRCVSGLVAAASAKELVVINWSNGKRLWHTAAPVTFGFREDGTKLVAVYGKGEVIVFEASSGKQLSRQAFTEKRTVAKAVLSDDSALAVLGVANGQNLDFVLVETATGKTRYAFSGPTASSWHAAFAADGKSFVTSRILESMLCVWPTTPPKPDPAKPGVHPIRTHKLTSAPLLATVSMGGVIAVAAQDGSIVLIGKDRPTLTWPNPKTAASAILFRYGLAAVRDGVLYTWSVASLR